MTPKELAARLNGAEYPFSPSYGGLAAEAKAAGLVIVYGASDDLMEFAGAIDEELGAWEGTTAHVDAQGLLPERESINEDDELRRYFGREPNARTIEALWAAEPGYSWTYKTDIPHATFEITEDGEPYCRGIVFAMSDVSAHHFTVTGDVSEFGELNDGVFGFTLRTTDGQEITVTGFTLEQIRSLKGIALELATLSIGRA